MRKAKGKKAFFGFIAVSLAVCLCLTAGLPERAYAEEMSADNGVASVLQKQSFYTGIIKNIFSKNPIGMAGYGIKGLLSLVCGKDPADAEITQILSELDEIKTTQSEMIQSLKTLETMVECEQLDSIINSFNALKDEWAPKIVYDSLLKAEDIEDPVQRTAEEKSYLLGGLGIDATSPLLNDASVPFDTYVEQFGKAISGPYKVTFTDSTGTSSEQGNIFWIYQQYKMRDPNTKWEHMATEDMAQFHIEVMGNYTIAAMTDLLSLNARIEAVEEYNSARPAEQRIGDQTIRDRFAMLMNQMEQIADIADQWEVEQHDEYRHLWVPGHELRIYPEAISKQQPEDKDNAMKYSVNVGYNMEYCESMTDYDTPNEDFWAPLFKYNDNSSLINYDQVNSILEAYDGNKSLYSILKDEAGITFPDNLSESNAFMLNPEPGHELTYRDHKEEDGFGNKVKQLVCYTCPGNATNVGSTQELILQEVSHWKSKFLFITTDKQGRVTSRHCGIDYAGIGYYGGGYGEYIEPFVSANTSTIEPENAKSSKISASWKDGEKEILDVALYGNGTKIADYRLSAADNWTKEIEWEDALDEQGNPATVTYSLKANTPEGYTSTVSGDIESGFQVTLAVKKTALVKSDVTLRTTSYTYNGKAKKPAVTVTSGGVVLKEGTDYTVKYSDNKIVGTASATVTGKGHYTGTVRKTFKILPKGTSISSVKAGNKQITIKWKKQAAQTTGYQIQYSTKKDFSSGKVSLTIKNNKTVKKTIKNLKAGKKYYVRIRTVKPVNGKKYYSAWSKASYTIVKAANPMTVKGKTASVSYKALSKKDQKLAASKVLKISKNKGNTTCKKVSGNAKIRIARDGKVTVKKGLKKNTYTVKVKVTAAGNANYNPATKTVSFKITVK